MIEEVDCRVTFHVDMDPAIVEALTRKAREVDDGNGADAPETYEVMQAFQVVWHAEPEWLIANRVLRGWTLDKYATDEDGWRSVWP